MDGNHFDQLTRLVGKGASRRSILKGLLGLGSAAVSGSLVASDADARAIGTRPTIPPPTTRPPATTTTTPAPCPGQVQCPNSTVCCDAGTCARSGNQAICCTGTVCGHECCSQGPLQCCDNECCSTDAVCLARVFEGSTPDGEEACCPIARTCGEQCCDGTCFDPVGLPASAGFLRECCPAEATFCAGTGSFAGQGVCCAGETPDCCHDELGMPVCLTPSQCCSSEECDGCSTCEDFSCEPLCSACCDAGDPADWLCLSGECCPNIPDYCSGGRFCCPEVQQGFGTHCEECCADADCSPDSRCCDFACVDGECCNDQDCVDIGRGEAGCVICHHFENGQGQQASSCILLGTDETEFNCGGSGFCCYGECLDTAEECVPPCDTNDACPVGEVCCGGTCQTCCEGTGVGCEEFENSICCFGDYCRTAGNICCRTDGDCPTGSVCCGGTCDVGECCTGIADDGRCAPDICCFGANGNECVPGPNCSPPPSTTPQPGTATTTTQDPTSVSAPDPTTCRPDCTNRTCGDDGCGGSCGTCTEFPNSFCNEATGACDCTPIQFTCPRETNTLTPDRCGGIITCPGCTSRAHCVNFGFGTWFQCVVCDDGWCFGQSGNICEPGGRTGTCSAGNCIV